MDYSSGNTHLRKLMQAAIKNREYKAARRLNYSISDNGGNLMSQPGGVTNDSADVTANCTLATPTSEESGARANINNMMV